MVSEPAITLPTHIAAKPKTKNCQGDDLPVPSKDDAEHKASLSKTPKFDPIWAYPFIHSEVSDMNLSHLGQ